MQEYKYREKAPKNRQKQLVESGIIGLYELFLEYRKN